MRSAELDLSRYRTDKIKNNYLSVYDQMFQPWLVEEFTLLEIGVKDGGSIELWRDYFPRARIVGIDLMISEDLVQGERVSYFQGDQTDLHFLGQVAKMTTQDGFGIVIDDASHIAELTKRTFWYLFENHLKPNGLYVIEDWGTGYWHDWYDGRSFRDRPYLLQRFWSSCVRRNPRLARLPIKIPLQNHSYGMVGLVKQLVDEVGAADRTRRSIKMTSKSQSRFEELVVKPSIAFVRKKAKSI